MRSCISHMESQSSQVVRCEKWLKEACYDITDHISCVAAQQFCAQAINAPYRASGRYTGRDIRRMLLTPH